MPRSYRFLSTLAAVTLVTVGCADDGVPTSPSLDSAPLLQRNGGADHQTADVISFDTDDPVDGASANLVRSPNGIRVQVNTRGLEPGHTYTVWWVVFNDPEACAAGVGACSGTDIGEATRAAVFGPAAGGIAGRDGSATFAGSTFAPPNQVLVQEGLQLLEDPLGAEVHIVVRSHGPKIPGMIREQISTVMGGCEQNDCADVQFAVFPPVGFGG